MSWTRFKLGQISHLHYGKSLSGYPVDRTDEYSVRVFGTNGPIGWTKTALIEHPTLVIGRKGAYRGVNFCEQPSWTIDTAFYTTIDESLILLKWFYYRLLQLDINRMNSGGAIPSTSREDFYSAEIRIPSLQVQQRIAEILSTYDDLIENNRRRIALLEEAARLLYREWFVHFRFPGHEHVKIIDGIPEGWEQKTLGDIAKTNEDSFDTKNLPDEINYIDISSVAKGRVVSRNKMTATDAPGRARRKAKDGDIIWSNVRPNLRAYALILDPDEADVFSTGFTVLCAREVPFTWLYQFVTTDNFVGHLVNHATGAGYPAVRSNDFERATVTIPPNRLLASFHDEAEPNFRLIAKLEQQNQKLAQARDLLLPRLMNGEIAV